VPGRALIYVSLLADYLPKLQWRAHDTGIAVTYRLEGLTSRVALDYRLLPMFFVPTKPGDPSCDLVHACAETSANGQCREANGTTAWGFPEDVPCGGVHMGCRASPDALPLHDGWAPTNRVPGVSRCPLRVLSYKNTVGG
jgi:hypothetical protein